MDYYLLKHYILCSHEHKALNMPIQLKTRLIFPLKKSMLIIKILEPRISIPTRSQFRHMILLVNKLPTPPAPIIPKTVEVLILDSSL